MLKHDLFTSGSTLPESQILVFAIDICVLRTGFRWYFVFTNHFIEWYYCTNCCTSAVYFCTQQPNSCTYFYIFWYTRTFFGKFFWYTEDHELYTDCTWLDCTRIVFLGHGLYVDLYTVSTWYCTVHETLRGVRQENTAWCKTPPDYSSPKAPRIYPSVLSHRPRCREYPLVICRPGN